MMSAAPAIAMRLREATFAAYDRIIELCVTERVEALLVAGDIYDGADRSLGAQLKFVNGLQRLEEAGIRSFVCHGNHDPLDGWEAGLTLPPGCHRFGPRVEGVPLGDSGRALVYGVSYPRREIRENLAVGFPPAESGVFSIGLLHCNVGGNTGHADYAPCTLDDLTSTGIDYWALGHVHNQQVLSERDPVVVYPGNPQGRNPREKGARGVYLVDVSDSGRVELQFRPVDVVRWEQVEVSIGELQTEQQLLDRLDSEVGALVGRADSRDVVFRLEIGGSGPLHHSVRRQGFVDDLKGRINEDWGSGTPFAWCERIESTTRTPFDREERRQGNDFVADLLRMVDDIRGHPERAAELGQELQVLYNHNRARRYLREFTPEQGDLTALLQEAETICLDQLVGEDAP